jgi:hypothetical protein
MGTGAYTTYMTGLPVYLLSVTSSHQTFIAFLALDNCGYVMCGLSKGYRSFGWRGIIEYQELHFRNVSNTSFEYLHTL